MPTTPRTSHVIENLPRRRGIRRAIEMRIMEIPLRIGLLVLAAGCAADGASEDGSKIEENLRSDGLSAAQSTMWVGADVNKPEASASSWLAQSSKFGPWRVRRSFNPGLPSNISQSAAAKDAENDIISFLSVKPPTIEGVAKGDYDDSIRSLAASFPKDHTTYLTMYHEPENDMSGPTFVKLFQHFYHVAKTANSHIQIGYVAMSYQWRPGSKSTKNADDWWVGASYTDFLGVDDYNDATTSGRTNAGNDPAFQRWYDWAKIKGKPLAVVEFGRLENPSDANARKNDLLASETYLRNSGFFMFLYWHATGTGGVDWRLSDGPTGDAMRTISSHGRTGW